jgi:hypothetical protein
MLTHLLRTLPDMELSLNVTLLPVIIIIIITTCFQLLDWREIES